MMKKVLVLEGDVEKLFFSVVDVALKAAGLNGMSGVQQLLAAIQEKNIEEDTK